MTDFASIGALLHDLDDRSPAGFAIALHIRFTTPTFMFQTYARRWLDHYTAAGLLLTDPVVRWGFQHDGWIRWSDLEAMDDARVLEQAKDFGLMNGVAVATVSAGSRTIAGFARADREYSDAEIAALGDRLGQLHAATVGVDDADEDARAALTALSVRLTH